MVGEAGKVTMSVLQRRLASSTYALLRSFDRRIEKLTDLIRQVQERGNGVGSHLCQFGLPWGSFTACRCGVAGGPGERQQSDVPAYTRPPQPDVGAIERGSAGSERGTPDHHRLLVSGAPGPKTAKLTFPRE
jgi:hypothetical protein